jgi:hypothetical protein
MLEVGEAGVKPYPFHRLGVPLGIDLKADLQFVVGKSPNPRFPHRVSHAISAGYLGEELVNDEWDLSMVAIEKAQVSPVVRRLAVDLDIEGDMDQGFFCDCRQRNILGVSLRGSFCEATFLTEEMGGGYAKRQQESPQSRGLSMRRWNFSP